MKKNILSLVIGISFGVLFLFIWSRLVDTGALTRYLYDLKLSFVILAAIFYLLAYFVRALRWRLLLRTIFPISCFQSFLILMGGNFTNYLIPLRAGDLMKCFFIKKRYGIRVSETLPSVFVDKLFDTVGIVIVLVLIPTMAITLPFSLNILLLIILLVILTGITVLFASAYSKTLVVSILKKVLFFIPDRFEQKMEETLSIFVEGLALFKHEKRLLLPMLAYSLLALLLDSFFFYSLFLAFGQVVSYFYVLLGYTLIYLSYIVPHPPAQIGSNELIMVLIFTAGFGMQADGVSAIMVFSHLLTGLLIILFGFIAYSVTGVKLLNIFNKGDELYEPGKE